jgi:hypothetical protein
MTVTAIMPSLPLLTLSEAEQGLVTRLNNLRSAAEPSLLLRDAYYNGTQVIKDFGISIPPQMRGLAVVIGWPQVAVDALDERLEVEGFRWGTDKAAEQRTNEIWQENDLDNEGPLAHLDALIHRAAYICIGSNDDGSALVTPESELSMSAIWDPRTRSVGAALRVYGADEHGRHALATLYLPDETISLAQNDSGDWEIDERDQHNLGETPVVRLANRQRTSQRQGNSEITSAIMALTDSACRTLVGMEVAREFYAATKLILLGGDESAFVGPDGAKRSVWETYIGRILAITRDEQGELPSLEKLEGSDPTPFTRVMAEYRQNFAAVSKLPPHMLGETTANPASADAIRSAEAGLVKRVKQKQRAFECAWENAMRLALRIEGDGVLPNGAELIETVWANPATPTFAADSDGLHKQTQAGIIPAHSDVVRERAGWSLQERARLAEDDKVNLSEEFIAAIADAIEARGERSVSALENVGTNLAAPPTPQTTGTPAG